MSRFADAASTPRVLLLPGATGDGAFWSPVARRLPAQWETVALDWPGLGDVPPDPAVRGIDDLVELAVARLAERSDLVAQSMGGVVALRVAARHPDRVRRLVLVATSGGLDLTAHGAGDWRPEYRRDHPRAASWITEPATGDRATIERVAAPTLLLWGDADPISPVSVGAELAGLLPDATLRVIPGGTHGVAREQPEAVAGLIAEHLR